MNGDSLSRKLSGLVIPAVLLLAPLAAQAQAPIRNNNLVPFYDDVRGPACSATDPAMGIITMTTPLDTPLFNRTVRGPAHPEPFCDPILAPDGHQVTLGEFAAVQGTATVKCISTGTHSVLHFSNLVPNGVYTVWLFILNSVPDPPYMAAGALGTTNPIENFFTASASGEGQIAVTTPEEDLSALGHVGACWLNSPAQVHLVYHIDQQTHGPMPGPLNAWVVNARFFFP